MDVLFHPFEGVHVFLKLPPHLRLLLSGLTDRVPRRTAVLLWRACMYGASLFGLFVTSHTGFLCISRDKLKN